MCALTAGQRGRKIIVLEGSNKIGKKILMSGGGRCNFTNLYCDPAHFLSANRHFMKSALARYTQWDFIALVERHGIPYHEKTLGQLFCDRSSKDIVAMLAAECDDAGVDIRTHCAISEVEQSDGFIVKSDIGDFAAPMVVVATGGLSIPKMGASDFGYRLARQFGLEVLPTSAGLVPFTFTGDAHAMTDRLAGVSTDVVAGANGVTFRESILFTHRGLSGPAALQVSSYWHPGDDIEITLAPDEDLVLLLLDAKRTQPKSQLRSVLASVLPRSLVSELEPLLWPSFADRPLAEISNDALTTIARRLGRWHLKPAATEGYRTAEVTLGGVDTTELSSQTMEAKKVPGLYFVGEVVDVTGHLGGFNFQWAWASGRAAGEAL